MFNLDFSFGEAFMWLTTSGVQIAVGIASFRRSRCLSRYPIWRSVLVGFWSGTFAFIWLVLWALDRRDIAAQWERHRASRREAPVEVHLQGAGQ